LPPGDVTVTVRRTHPLTRDAQALAWARFMSWQIRSRFRSEIISPWIEGQNLAVSRGMSGAMGNLYAGLHEFEEMGFLLHLLREGDLFLDIGANIGSYTVLAAGVCGADCVAFEPDPESARRLARNVAINALDRRVAIQRCALGERCGEVAFTVGRDAMNRIASDDDDATQRVPPATLDAEIGAAQPVTMKIDVEGFEERVLRGVAQTLRRESLRAIIIKTVTEASGAMLADAGFVEARYDSLHRALTQEGRPHGALNALFVRDLDYVATRVASARAVSVFGRKI